MSDINWYKRGYENIATHMTDSIDEMLARYPEHPTDAERETFIAGVRDAFQIWQDNVRRAATPKSIYGEPPEDE